MAQPQSYAHHAKYDPKFHFFIAPLLLLLFVYAAQHAIRHRDVFSHAFLGLVFLVLGTAVIARGYALRVQDRVIRLEERLRIATLAPALQSRLGEFTEAQLIGLRFAGDAELPALAARALNEKLSRDAIKQAITHWRADDWRV